MIQSIVELLFFVKKKRKLQFICLIVLSIGASLSEVFTLSLFMPFIAMIIDSGATSKNTLSNFIRNFAEYIHYDNLMGLVCIILVAGILITATLRLLLVWAQTKLGSAVGSDLCSDLYKTILNQPYSFYLNQNTSELIALVFKKTNDVVDGVIIAGLFVCSSMFLLIAIGLFILLIQPEITLSVGPAFVIIYYFISRFARKKLANFGEVIRRNQNKIVKILQESFGGIRDVIIDGNQSRYCGFYKDTDINLREAQVGIYILASSPRFVIEAIAMLIITSVSYVVYKSGDVQTFIPLIGVLALSVQRALPIMQQVYYSTTLMRGAEPILNEVLSCLRYNPTYLQGLNTNKDLLFNKSIVFDDVSYKYASDEINALSNISLAISKGENIGIIGSTGSGKSTFLDVLMGLIPPSSGSIYIDDQKLDLSNVVAWQRNISHVPQSIFIFDSTFSENIAFGVPGDQIDYKFINKIIDICELRNVVDRLPKGLNTMVGERGLRLSGGQKQRLGIARALYKKGTIIILDEATSALDINTESKIIANIKSNFTGLTIVSVAHRLTTLSNCNRIFELDNGKISRWCTYEEILDQ